MTRHHCASIYAPYRLLTALVAALALLTASVSLADQRQLPVLAAPAPERPADPAPPFRVTSVHQWIVDWMVSVSPPGVNYVKDAKETAEEGRRRYEQIADDAISVAYDEEEKPLFGGKYARAMTAAVIMSLAFNESAFRKDVDLNIGPKARGDNGQSWCMMQIKLGRPVAKTGRTDMRIVFDGSVYRFVKDASGARGWGGEDLVDERQRCFRAGLRIARMSFNACRKHEVKWRLANYASGDGSCTLGREASEARMNTAMGWLAKRRPPLADEEVMSLLRLGPPRFLPVPPGSRVSAVIPGVPEGIAPS